MTNETKHTPTPWKMEDLHGDTQIVGPQGSLICIDTTYYPIAPSEEDMAHIVKCVNMHDELVEALNNLHIAALQSDVNDMSNDYGYDALSASYETLKKAGAL